VSPSRGLLDTNVLILRAGIDPAELPEQMAISSITLAELSVGPLVTTEPPEVAARLKILQGTEAEFEPLPFDAAAAREYGQVWAAARTAGRKPRRRTSDLMIASVAIANDLPLYTVNAADFNGLDHLLTIKTVTHPDDRVAPG
jgi:predicted nucleic acid-binding protein